MNKIPLSLFLALLLFSCKQQINPVFTGLEGKPIPAFNLLLIDSVTYVNTSNSPLGKPVVLFYFSPYCPYCRAQTEGIIKNISSLKDIHIYMFTAWPLQDLKEFYKHYDLSKYPNISVGIDYTHYFQAHFNAVGVPYTAIYGKDRKLNSVFMGSVPSEQIKEVAEN